MVMFGVARASSGCGLVCSRTLNPNYPRSLAGKLFSVKAWCCRMHGKVSCTMSFRRLVGFCSQILDTSLSLTRSSLQSEVAAANAYRVSPHRYTHEPYLGNLCL